MLHEDGRKEIERILGNISFEGHFNMVFDNLKESRQKKLLDWVRDCRDGIKEVKVKIP